MFDQSCLALRFQTPIHEVALAWVLYTQKLLDELVTVTWEEHQQLQIKLNQIHWNLKNTV